MDNYSMNIGPGGVEQDRSCDIQGFDNLGQYLSKTSTNMTGVPYEATKPVGVVPDTSDTDKLQVPPSAADITARTRMGG